MNKKYDIIVIGATISASIPFFIARFLGREYVQKKNKSNNNKNKKQLFNSFS